MVCEVIMYDYVIVHASFGHPFEHWYSWLVNKLISDGKNVLCPQFPCGIDIQNYDNWASIFDAYRPYLDENTSYIGHSIGPAFILSYLTKNNLKAKDLYLVVPFSGTINVPDYDYVNSSFMNSDDWSSVINLTRKRLCYVSGTDPYVPNELSYNTIRLIDGDMHFVNDAGHFNTMAGYTTFEQLYGDIKSNFS